MALCLLKVGNRWVELTHDNFPYNTDFTNYNGEPILGIKVLGFGYKLEDRFVGEGNVVAFAICRAKLSEQIFAATGKSLSDYILDLAFPAPEPNGD